MVKSQNNKKEGAVRHQRGVHKGTFDPTDPTRMLTNPTIRRLFHRAGQERVRTSARVAIRNQLLATAKVLIHDAVLFQKAKSSKPGISFTASSLRAILRHRGIHFWGVPTLDKRAPSAAKKAEDGKSDS